MLTHKSECCQCQKFVRIYFTFMETCIDCIAAPQQQSRGAERSGLANNGVCYEQW
jgi:hypothetical protein